MRHIWNKLVCLLLVLALCLTCAVPAMAAEKTINIVGANMTLGNDLKINFMIKKADMQEGFVAKVSQAGAEPVLLELADYNSAYYAASYSVAAKEMTDVLSVQICDADGNVVSNPFTRTIKQYAMTLLNNVSQPESLKCVIVDMLNYGTQAQKYFGHNEDAYANADVTAEQQAAYATAEVEVTNNQQAGENFVGANLSLEDSILLNVFFKGISGGDVTGITATVSFTDYLGKEVTADAKVSNQGTSMVKVVVDQIVLADAKRPVTVTVYKNGEAFGSGVESVESYIARNLAGATADLNMAIMKFSRSAFLHLGGVEEDPHNWNTGELVLPVTETTDGQALYTCLDDDCGETKLETIPAGTTVYTRADLEEALEELSWDYLLKKDKIQYDSMELGAVGKYYGGKFLVTEEGYLEKGTSHTEINSVCSDYVWKVYEEAFNHHIFYAENSLEVVTADMWLHAEDQIRLPDEEDIDSCLVRWQSLAFTDEEVLYDVPDSPHFVQTKEEVFEYFLNWETMLRPGDVLVDKGHALIYAGNGKVLHCNGTKYQPTTGVLNHEDSGAVYGVSPLSCEDTSWLKTRANSGRLIVFRPNEFLVTKDTDGDLSNDMVRDPNFVMPADTVSRLAYPGMEIDRTVNITPIGTASVGQELTYSVKISNLSNNTKYMAAMQVSDPAYAGVGYEDLIVTETIPEGTQFVSATEGGVYEESTNTITWTFDIAAGKAVTPAYTVKVTADIGDTIVNGGGFVADIPSNVICNRVGGEKMNEFAVTSLGDLAKSTADWNFGTDLAFAEKIYEAAETGLELPTVSEVVEELFVWTKAIGAIRTLSTRYPKLDPIDVFMLRDTDSNVRDMLIDTYYGGYRFFTGDDAIGSTISEFRFAYLEPGDIIVNCDTANGKVTGAQVMVYAGNDTLLICNADGSYQVLSGNNAKLQLWNSFLQTNELFFALRPSQVSDLKAAHTWDAGEITKVPTCAAEGEMTFTCLDDGCGKTKIKVLAKTTDHDWSDDAANNGNGTHTITCTLCGTSKSEAHKWDDGVGDSAQKLFTCTVCAATKTEVGSLSAEQIALLQSFTYTKGNMTAAANIRQAPPHYADTIYAAICMDGLAEKFASYTAAGALGQAFKVLTNGGYGNYDRDYVLRTEANGYISENGTAYQVAAMVVDGFYGGPWLLDEDGNRLTNRGADMRISDLQPGDVILLGENSAQFEAVMWTVVYQGVIDGNHRFLFGNSYYGGTYTNVAANSIGYRGYLDFDAETLLLTDALFNASLAGAGSVAELTMENGIGACSFQEFLMNDPVSGMQWEYFYAIRPCKVMGTGTHTWDNGAADESGTTYTCTVCGTTKKEVVVTHTWDAGTVTKAATCGEAGILTYTCTDCGETKTEVIAATGKHSFGAAQELGDGHCYTCTVCGESKSEAHTWNADGTVCTACGASAGTTDYALTDEQIAALQALTYHKGSMTAAANSRQRPVHFADTIYAAIGLDGLVEKFHSLTAAGVLSQGFMRTGTGTGYGSTDRDYVLRTAENGYLVVDGITYHVPSMMVDGFYGGSWIVDEDGNRMTDAADAMNIRDLQPGDVLLLGENTGSYDALLWVLVYQGVIDGKDTFIFGNTYYGSNYTNVSATTSYRGKLCFNAQTGVLEQAVFSTGISSTGTVVEVPMEAQIGTTTFRDFLKEDVVSGVAWEYFYAIRPGKVMNN